MEILGIDIGGSGVKGAPVNIKTGELVADRYRHRARPRSRLAGAGPVNARCRRLAASRKRPRRVRTTPPAVSR